jgi:hypothetical protein
MSWHKVKLGTRLLGGKRLRRNVPEEKELRTKLLGGKWPRTKPLGGKRLRRDVLVRERAEDKGTLRSVVPAGGGC